MGGIVRHGRGVDVTVSDDLAVSATFAARQVRLSITIAGSGTVRSTPAAIDCSGACFATFPAGTRVHLEATAADGFAFSGFGGDCSSSACDLDLSQPRSVSAAFAVAIDTLTVRVRGAGRGRVVSV